MTQAGSRPVIFNNYLQAKGIQNTPEFFFFIFIIVKVMVLLSYRLLTSLLNNQVRNDYDESTMGI
jgi:hypothetical protein